MIEQLLTESSKVLGPLAVVLIVFLGVILFVYRLDVLNYRSVFQRLVEDHIKSQTTLVASIDRMSKSIDKAEDQRQRNFDLLMRAIDRRS